MTATPSKFWGNTIRELRLARNVSERQLAREAGVNRSTLRKIEEGTSMCSVAILERLLDYLGYELEVMAKQSPAQRARRHVDDAHPDWRSRMAATRLLKLSTGDMK